MSGGGELAAVFQARRSGGGSVTTNKKMEATVETTTSSLSSGELAAIFQVRKKMANGDVGSSNITTPPRPVPTAVAAATTTPLSPSPVAKDTPKFPLPSPKATTTPATTKLVSASPIRNKTLTATFESRDLEVGIPTPGFLQDMRKNLKKPGEKKVVTSSLSAAKAAATVSTAGTRGGAASGGDDTVEKTKQTIAPEQRDEGEGGLTSASSSSSSAKLSSTTAREQSHQDLMAARRSRMVASRSARSDKSVSSGSGAPASNNNKTTSGNTSSLNNNNNNNTSRSAKSDNSIGGGTPTNKNKSKTLLPIKTSTPTGPTSSAGGTSTLTPGTPASARREKLRARVRASSSSSSTHHLKTTTPTAQSNLRNGQLDKLQTDLSADEVSSPGKVFISSPTKDEFEMSFFDANHPGPTIPDFDENGNDQRQKLMKQAPSMELRTDSVDSMYKDLHTTSTGSTLKTANNSSASRDFRHRASTPKICGSQQSVYDEQKYTMAGGDHNANHRRESSNGSSDPYNHLQPYAVTRSPSQGSQMSAITTPSCFPQDNPAYPSASGGQHGMNAPVILEAITSFGSTPTSKSSHEEIMHLREQMKEFKQKLAEKDAIISQLMRRISDLEQGHPRTSFGTGNNASAFSSPKASASTKVSNSKGGHTGDSRRKPFNNLASQSVQSNVRSTEMKKFVC